MSKNEDPNTSTSSMSSNYQSPVESKSKPAEIQVNTIKNKHIDIIFANILLTVLAKNRNQKDYITKINNNQDGHFTYKVKPSISLLDYLRRIIKYVKIEYSTLIIALIYIDRICKKKV